MGTCKCCGRQLIEAAIRNVRCGCGGHTVVKDGDGVVASRGESLADVVSGH